MERKLWKRGESGISGTKRRPRWKGIRGKEEESGICKGKRRPRLKGSCEREEKMEFVARKGGLGGEEAVKERRKWTL